MKTFILILTIAAFIQSSFLPINLVLILLICRSLTTSDGANLVLAFFGGILLGVLSSTNLGFLSLIMIVVVKLIDLIKKLPISINVLTAIPISFVIILAVEYFEQIFMGQTLNFPKVMIETLLVIPVSII